MTMKSVLAVLSMISLASAAAMAAEVDLDQNWSKKDIAYWQNETQGSRLAPLSWVNALEIKESKVPFMSDDNIKRYGYTPGTTVFNHRSYRLPRGFVVDTSDDKDLTFSHLRWKGVQASNEPWVGLNCAACHTTNISYKGQTLVIQGGPTNADFQKFFQAFREALADTLSDKDKFDRFAGKVLTDVKSDSERLRVSLVTLNKFLSENERLNNTSSVYGPGRVDAVGHILNRVAQLNGAKNSTPNPSDAPVSYPFLWNTSQHDRVQWNGVAPNKKLGKDGFDVGALARNASEVVGVFGDVNFKQEGPFKFVKGYMSSVPVNRLAGLERTLEILKPPKWPTNLGEEMAIKNGKDGRKDLVKDGRYLFEKNCSSCHQPLARDNLNGIIVAQMATISRDTESSNTITTDPWMACNAVQFKSDPGDLSGKHLNELTGSIDKQSPLVTQLGVTAREVLLNQKGEIVRLALMGFLNVTPERPVPPQTNWFSAVFSFLSEKESRLNECYEMAKDTKKYPTLAYKARPLTGIWATGPFLHNGSVRTLYDLLLPPAERPTKFKVGSIEFDPVQVGFIDAYGPGEPFDFDTSLPGNSKNGHDYGASKLDDTERYQLIEYMKTL
ncbi:hypothetical protein TMS3_0103800 [Pseudomonas taeanensis MS-3]|uniref:Cytochrome c domain-containing protein n=1 Tax=Pseudomonas taeanensis MS-3 TaxID=1395571 RepID=A0A0A1YQ05_9PSED|nr:di-heme-cytochrome C peroxidase [Pseudomonas taeanensis]KFX71078.1 hypothetical protein TMS3_0103800 [Pseudomonas taeanensis MS-3]